MPTCSKCRAQLPEDALHCPSCGADVPTDPGTDPAVPRASKAVTAPDGVDSEAEDVQDRLQKAMGRNYEVKGCVGRGGFAEVYEVLDIHLERRLAAKVLIPEIAADPGTRRRFTHEARTVARLNHPAILPIHFVGDAENLAYYVMPFIEGDSVQDVLRRQAKMTTAETVAVAKPILEALSHAHDVGLIHRDIKPDNVMIDAKTHRAIGVRPRTPPTPGRGERGEGRGRSVSLKLSVSRGRGSHSRPSSPSVAYVHVGLPGEGPPTTNP